MLDKVPGNIFFKYLLSQKRLLIIAVAVFAVLYLALKFFFPLPDFFGDSFTYIGDAMINSDITFRPKGYPIFLMLMHYISGSANFVVFAQYLLFFLSTLFCFFSCDHLFGFPEKFKKVAFYLALVNPVLIFQANLISSDSLFCSLTVVWFTLCFWAIKKHNWPALILQAVFLVLCFQVRYTALFFPLVGVAAFTFSRGRVLYKLAGIAITISVIYFSVERQKNLIKAETGEPIFSGFSGWQIANNVLCYYKEIKVDKDDFPSIESELVDRFVKRVIDSVYTPNYVGTKYIWDKTSPLKIYLYARLKYTKNIYYREWWLASRPLSEFGWSIIKHNPMAYARYFMAPNFINFLYPDPEALTNYDGWHSILTIGSRQWYGLESDHLYCRFPGLQKKIIAIYPAIFFILNLVNLVLIFAFLFKNLKIWRKTDKYARSLFYIWSLFYFGYLLFSVFSTTVLLRYLDPLFTLGIVMPFVLFQQYKFSRVSG